jgi:Fe-S-cluster-containing dehydrogenase component
MPKYGLLIEYDYCTGCHSCEVACQQEHGYPAGKFGIIVTEHILETMDGLSIYYLPFPTDLCNLCSYRTKGGQKPACVKHCQAACMHFGPIDQLNREMEKKSKTVLFSPA